MTSLFEKEIDRLQREVRDLKTSHLLGAGTTRFYQKNVTIEPGATRTVRITIAQDEPMPPLLVVLYSGGIWTAGTNVPSNRTYVWSIYTSVAFVASVISSSVIESVEVS